MKPICWKILAGVLLVLLLAIPAWALKAVAPGTVNYAEGEAKLENQPLDKDSIGSVDLRPGQALNTGAEGKTEVLLGPGQIFRLGDNSSVQMIANNPPEVELTKGQATVQILPNRTGAVLVREAGSTTRLEKSGLYFFDADSAKVFVYKGEAEVQSGVQTVKLKSGRALDLNPSGNLKVSKFDKKELERNELVQFSGLRSEYLAEANAETAHAYYVNSGGWYGPGWYWSPAFWAYTWVPGGDYFCDPFGWCFYSPMYSLSSPFLFTGFFGDFGPGCFGHTHRGRARLPGSFTGLVRPGTNATSAGAPSAMAGNTGTAGGTRGVATPSVFNHSGFNRGTIGAGGSSGRSVSGGAISGGRVSGAPAGRGASGTPAGGGISGAHGPSGGGSMGGHAGGGFGGMIGGGRR